MKTEIHEISNKKHLLHILLLSVTTVGISACSAPHTVIDRPMTTTTTIHAEANHVQPYCQRPRPNILSTSRSEVAIGNDGWQVTAERAKSVAFRRYLCG